MKLTCWRHLPICSPIHHYSGATVLQRNAWFWFSIQPAYFERSAWRDFKKSHIFRILSSKLQFVLLVYLAFTRSWKIQAILVWLRKVELLCDFWFHLENRNVFYRIYFSDASHFPYYHSLLRTWKHFRYAFFTLVMSKVVFPAFVPFLQFDYLRCNREAVDIG